MQPVTLPPTNSGLLKRTKMDNFILYGEIGKGSRSVVYKGRKKGSLKYIAIICTTKAKKTEITNHVRFSYGLRHPNIVTFHEWYETSDHFWLIVELCTGGSLESVIRQDGCLTEDVVKKFGWDLVKGLKHVHESGIVFGGLNPSKIMLDGSGILKLGNFCLSKGEGETVKDVLSVLSIFESSKVQEIKDEFHSMQKRLKGYPAYISPEVLLGSETSMSSDLWALGCILYHMFTGKPPFHASSYTELNEMILYQNPPPPRQTGALSSPPSEDFLNLLKGLLKKNLDKRMTWPELIEHPFWADVLMEEEEEEEEEEEGDQKQRNGSDSVGSENSRQMKIPDRLTPREAEMLSNNHCTIQQPACLNSKKLTLSQISASPTDGRSDTETDSELSAGDLTYGAFRDSKGMDEKVGEQEDEEVEAKPEAAQEMCRTLHPKNMSKLRPKSGVDEDNTEAIFLLSSSSNSRSCNISKSPHKNSAPQTSTEVDITSKVKSLLHTDSDLTVTPVMDNPKILKSPLVRFDQKTLCVPAYSVEKLQSFRDEEWKVFLLQLCSSLKDQNISAAPSTAAFSSATSTRSKLNLLCYLCCVVGHTVVANRLINSVLLSVLTQQLRHAPNWDVKGKALRVMGLLVLHCTELREESSVSETVSTLTDLLRENLRNSRVKQFLLPPLGDLLYLIASQEEKRGSPEGLWFVPAAAYTGLMRSLREGDESIVHHMAAKAIENISTCVSDSSHPLVTSEIGAALWYLFTHSTVEAVRVTAISSLSRLTRVVPTVFLSVIDTCGPAAILEGVGGAGARVQQHLLSAMASALLTSHIHVHRITQSRDLVLKVQGCLDSPSTVTRAKTLLLLLQLIQNNTNTLLLCCQNRLMMYLERDLRKATPLRENPGQSYLCQCMGVLTVYLASTAPLILDNVLSALQNVTGRKHPSAAQSKQLKQTLPTMSIVLELVSSQVLRSHIVTTDFLAKMGLLLNYITSIESKETNLSGSAVCEEFIRASLSIVEILSQYHALTTPQQNIVVDVILPPLTTLVFSKNVEWSVFALRVLSEFSLVLLDEDCDVSEEEEGAERNKEGEEKRGRAAVETDDGSRCNHIPALIDKCLLPRYESLLRAVEPTPLYALKLLLSLTEHSTQMCRLIKQRRILPTVLQLIMANSSNVNSGLTQNAIALLCNLSRMEPLHQPGLVEMMVSTLSEAAQVYLEAAGHAGRKVSHLVLQALLELLHIILNQVFAVFHTDLQSQRLSCPAVEMEAAENLILENRPLSQLSTLLIHMLSTENQELRDESFQCLSLLVQMYGGECYDCLKPSCLQSFSHVLHKHMHSKTPTVQLTTLRIIKELVKTTEQPDWFKCPEGAELISLLRDISTSNRCQVSVVSLAAEISNIISGS